MLVLSRKVGETIVIGDNVRVTVVAVHGNKLRLGIAAPPEVHIRRSELDRTKATPARLHRLVRPVRAPSPSA